VPTKRDTEEIMALEEALAFGRIVFLRSGGPPVLGNLDPDPDGKTNDAT
jgi:hypothetical protein